MGDVLSPVPATEPAPGSGTGRLLARALVLAHGSGPAVDEELRAVLAELAQDPESTLAELRRRSAAVDPNDFGLRWTLLYVTSMLSEPGSIEWLTEVASEALPPDPGAKEACESRTDSEVLVRVMATEAIVGLLSVDEGTATQALLEVIDLQPQVSIRAVAGQALVEHDPSFRDPLLELLPEEERFIVDLRRVPHTELTVGTEGLPPDDVEGSKPPPPASGDEGG